MEVISQIQKVILDNLGQIQDSNQFYLTGGTALVHFFQSVATKKSPRVQAINYPGSIMCEK
ncbi:MAG: hypothetical protein ACE5NG_04450 [bacterium]